jgi:hypothetical protein
MNTACEIPKFFPFTCRRYLYVFICDIVEQKAVENDVKHILYDPESIK